MCKLLTHLVTSLLLSSLLSACDSDLAERGKRYFGRVTQGVMDKLQSDVSPDRESISVLQFLPEPNYSNADGADNNQLTDAKLTRPPMWTRKDSVGWAGKTPVLIEVKRGDSSVVNGKVRLHSALGAYAGVQLPKQVDVYSKVDGGIVIVGSYRERHGLSLQDQRSYWLEVPVRGLTDTFVVVIHSNGWYVQLDELELVLDGDLKEKLVNPQILALNSLQEIQDHAAQQLIFNLEMRANDRFKSKQTWRKAYPKHALVSWVADPWAQDLDQLEPQQIDTTNTMVIVNGTNAEYEHFAIGVYSTLSGLNELDISLNGLPKESYELLSLERVLASDGRMAFDPLVPIKDSGLKLQSGWPHLLWVKLNLKTLPLGTTKAVFSVANKSKAFSEDYDVEVNVVDAGKSKNVPIRATVWGYSGDMPIWSDAELAIQNQLAHYVNRWIIAPQNIPGLALDGAIEAHKRKRLLADLARYKGKGKVRLYLGWTLESNPLGLTSGQYSVSATKEKALRSWLISLREIMLSAGYSTADWELYPIDEPTGSLLEALLPISSIIKKTLPDVVIYADPISTTADPSSEAQLKALNDTIDAWQPDLPLLEGKGQAFFSSLKKDWGFYQNPPLPPKRANPIEYYRSLGWWAWKTGATGIGFWSFSDTTNSSMWNDFDGRRPDFSVVYDRSGVLINSRRWEAFADGIEDYKIMQGAGELASLDLNPALLDKATIENLRLNALQHLK